ncbi:MAG: hypothetical protein E7598_02755 [Ruminococcaceae bacterium]|nr:hypothetical protein [Oscillospiraceae bacterium]
MIKRFLAVASVCVLCFALFSCGKDEATLAVDSLVGVGDAFSDSDFAKIFDSDVDSLRISASVDTLDGLKDYAYLLGVMNIPKVENAGVDLYFDIKDAKLAQTVFANIEGEKLDLTAVEDNEDIVIKSSIFDKVYGIKTKTLAEDWLDAADAFAAINDTLPAIVEYVSKSDKISEKYENALKDALRENVEFDKDKDGKFTVLSFEIGAKEMDGIFESIADVVEKDKDLEKLLKAFDAKVDDTVASMRDALDGTEGGENIKCELTVLEGKSKLVEMEIVFEDTIIEYEGNEKNNDFVMEITNGSDDVVEISLKDGEYAVNSKNSHIYDDGDYYLYQNSVKASVEDGELMLEISSLSEDKWGSEKDREETKVGVTFGYEIGGNKLSLTVKDVSYNGFGINNIDKKIGLTVEIEKNPKLPSLTNKYEEITKDDDFFAKVVEPAVEKIGKLLGY